VQQLDAAKLKGYVPFQISPPQDAKKEDVFDAGRTVFTAADGTNRFAVYSIIGGEYTRFAKFAMTNHSAVIPLEQLQKGAVTLKALESAMLKVDIKEEGKIQRLHLTAEGAAKGQRKCEGISNFFTQACLEALLSNAFKGEAREKVAVVCSGMSVLDMNRAHQLLFELLDINCGAESGASSSQRLRTPYLGAYDFFLWSNPKSMAWEVPGSWKRLERDERQLLVDKVPGHEDAYRKLEEIYKADMDAMLCDAR
jgi:hypothetical protein